MTQPTPGYLAVQPGHPEPEPIPEPEPPQPIPPPEPAPPPEPPHASSAAAEGAGFLDIGPPTTDLEWPPVGAYPGEPGYQDPAFPRSDEQETAAIPVMDDRTQVIDGVTAPAETGWREHPHWDVPLLPMERGSGGQRGAGLWASLAMVITLLLCGGGATSAYLLLRDGDSGRGAPDPATAVNRFMTAVYAQRDASAAAGTLCREARDERKLNARVNQIRGYALTYDRPAFRWSDAAVYGQNDERATVAVQLTMSTDDEKQAEQELTFTVVHKAGWLVCDIAG